MKIPKYSIVDKSVYFSRFDKFMYGVGCVCLGWILCATFSISLDAYICPFWPDPGVYINIDGTKWTPENRSFKTNIRELIEIETEVYNRRYIDGYEAFSKSM